LLLRVEFMRSKCLGFFVTHAASLIIILIQQ
jgi:hypothetical protein